MNLHSEETNRLFTLGKNIKSFDFIPSHYFLFCFDGDLFAVFGEKEQDKNKNTIDVINV